MNSQPNSPQLQDSRLKKRLVLAVLCMAYPAYIIHSCVTSPLFTVYDSNIETSSISLIFYGMNLILDLFVFFLTYSVSIYGMYRLNKNDLHPIFAVSILATVFKYVLKLIMTPIIDGFISWDQFFMDIYSIGISAVLEILQFVIIILLTQSYIKKYKAVNAIVNKASVRIGEADAPDMSALPYKSLFDLKNPLQRGAFISGVVVSAARIIMLLINDLSMKWSFENPAEILVFVGGYLLEIAVGVIGYMLMLYIFIILASKDK